jgi:hypothetical protein
MNDVYIYDENEARKYVEDLDFSAVIRDHLMIGVEDGGPGWTSEKSNETLIQYKNWLLLKRKYREELLPPTEDIDKFWHFHILNSEAYHRDCLAIFGFYLHHFPYFGVRNAKDQENLYNAFSITKRLYEVEFGERIG